MSKLTDLTKILVNALLANPGAANHDRHSLTQSFVQFSRGLALESKTFGQRKCQYQGASPSGTRSSSLKVPQTTINRSPSAPDLVTDKPPTKEPSPTSISANYDMIQKSTGHKSSRRTFANCALLNPSLLQRHALSVDETPNYRSNESLQHGTGSQGSMALDLHLESVTLKVRDKRRNPLKRQRKIEEDEHHKQLNGSRRNSNSWSPRLPKCHRKPRRSSNASDCTHRSSRSRRRESHSCHHARGHLERAISSDSRLTGAIPKCYHSHEPSRDNSTEHEHQQGTSTSESDIRKPHQVMVHFSTNMER